MSNLLCAESHGREPARYGKASGLKPSDSDAHSRRSIHRARETKNSTSTSSLFSFTNTKQEAAAPAEEAPAAPAAAAAAAPVFGSASTFGAGSGFAGFTGVAGAVAARSSGDGAAAGAGDEDDDAAGGAGDGDADDECQAEFKPVVQLAEVETVSGEEAEEALCDVKSKLYRFDHGSGEWKERGVGQVRLLRHRENDRIRLLFRQEKTLKVRANHVVMPGTSLKPHSGSDKALVWSAVDFSGDEQATELFCIRFASPERALEFKRKFEEAMAHNDKVIGGGGGDEEGEGGEEEAAAASPSGAAEGGQEGAAAAAADADDAKAAAEAKLKAEAEKKAESEAEADKLAAEVGEKAAVKEDEEK